MRRIVFLCCVTLGLLMANRWDAYLFSDDYTTVRQGIKLGGDLNSRWRGMTPLYNACRSGWGDIVELMISRGADINAKSYGETALLKVTGRKVNDVTLAKILLGNGAKVNVQDSQGNTPLYHAIMNKNGKMIKLLLDNGADMYIKNKRGDSPARFILSKKSMPSVSFEKEDLMLSAQSFLLGRSAVTIGVVNKTAQFMKVSQIAVYFNGKLVGELQVNQNIAPRATVPNVGVIKLPTSIYQSFKISEEGRSDVKYGLAIEYSLDGSSKSFEDSKNVELVLW
ncbi:ankyrin repeat domain-containing protein [Helicobacter kayseriensis]|uniref:ankyrin repeat domain-containing protein n=1 Tax=Helicobacter kayseriensis TaxID=2905877 RepID=UPI001E3F8764|nr:ankyrin repeat domain-containing protein [Helicobacter kayseriensis]MCE3046703.1 ankyrin repeat domain-containing protein [Helicobacter kayseriensis]MCE3047995.1 ankyrin repeat domain-containing protein [Helicobacter kayseriensis]